jgi:hypothetical protein
MRVLKVIIDKDAGEEVNRHKTKDISTIKDEVKTWPANGKGEGTSMGQIGKLPLSNWAGRVEIFFWEWIKMSIKARSTDYKGKDDIKQKLNKGWS